MGFIERVYSYNPGACMGFIERVYSYNPRACMGLLTQTKTALLLVLPPQQFSVFLYPAFPLEITPGQAASRKSPKQSLGTAVAIHLQTGCPYYHPTNSIKALMSKITDILRNTTFTVCGHHSSKSHCFYSLSQLTILSQVTDDTTNC